MEQVRLTRGSRSAIVEDAATSALLPLEPGHLVLPRPRLQLCCRSARRWRGRPRRAEGREAHLHGRQGVVVRLGEWSPRRPRVRALARRRRRRDLARAVPRARSPRRDEARPDAGLGGRPAVEAALRARLARERPGEPVLGEEEGGEDTSGWILDPIDGTRNYTRGIPVWATLIAFAERVAVVSAPALGRRWWAERGHGAYANGEPIHVSRDRAARGRDGPRTCSSRPPPLAAFAPGTSRGFGDFWAHMLVAEGAAEVAVDAPDLAVWDAAPLAIIVEEAGGRYESPSRRTGCSTSASCADRGLVDPVAAEQVELGREQVARVRRPAARRSDRLAVDRDAPRAASRRGATSCTCLAQPRAQPAGEQQRVRLRARSPRASSSS